MSVSSELVTRFLFHQTERMNCAGEQTGGWLDEQMSVHWKESSFDDYKWSADSVMNAHMLLEMCVQTQCEIMDCGHIFITIKSHRKNTHKAAATSAECVLFVRSAFFCEQSCALLFFSCWQFVYFFLASLHRLKTQDTEHRKEVIQNVFFLINHRLKTEKKKTRLKSA